jgi:hypothetical protein
MWVVWVPGGNKAYQFDSLYQLYAFHVGPLFSVAKCSHFCFRLNSRKSIRKIAGTASTRDDVVNLSTMYARPTASGISKIESVKADKSGVHIHQSSWSDAGNATAKFAQVWHQGCRLLPHILCSAFFQNTIYFPLLPSSSLVVSLTIYLSWLRLV